MNKISTHAAAELFPALPEGELADLAADIKEHGLREPLVILESTGELLDGRNRLEACRRAGVEPRTVAIEVADPRAYILSLKIHRRHLTKQQRAMVVAMLYPDKGRGKTPKNLGRAF